METQKEKAQATGAFLTGNDSVILPQRHEDTKVMEFFYLLSSAFQFHPKYIKNLGASRTLKALRKKDDRAVTPFFWFRKHPYLMTMSY
jgi:hypothetical protein